MVDLTNKEDRLIDIYEDINTWAINDIVKRIIKNDVITETAKYRIYRMQEAGIHLIEIKKKIKSITKKSNNEIVYDTLILINSSSIFFKNVLFSPKQKNILS